MSKRTFKPERYYQFFGDVTKTRLQRAYEAGEVVTGRIRGYDVVRGCLFVKLSNTEEGVLPFSECFLEPLKDTHNRIPGPVEKLIRKRIVRVKIVKWTDRQITLSRKKSLLEVLDKAQHIVLKRVGATVEGTAKNAVYCDIGDGLTAYCPVCEISRTHIDDATNWFKKGEVVKVIITGVDLETGKVTCSIKQGDACDYSKIFPNSNRKVKVGNPIFQKGNVTGYFVEITPGIAGIADIQENFTEKYGKLHPGDKVRVYIKQVLPDERKVKLVIK